MRLWFWLSKRYYAGVVAVLSLPVFANQVSAQPGFPPPPAPAGGDIAQAGIIGAVVAYGAWRLWKRK